MTTASYHILKSEPYTHKDYTVVSLRPQDIFAVMDWRNSQIDVLRQDKPLTPESQKNYFENTIRPTYSEDQPDLILLSILEKGELIGYGGLVHINWQARRAELSFLTETQRTEDLTTYEQDFSAFLVILKHIAFSELGFQRLSTETFNIRPHVITILADNGFATVANVQGGIDAWSTDIDTTIPRY